VGSLKFLRKRPIKKGEASLRHPPPLGREESRNPLSRGTGPFEARQALVPLDTGTHRQAAGAPLALGLGGFRR